MSDLFYLQDSRGDVGDRLSFWATKGCGYTANLDNTELFTHESAVQHYEGRHTDVPWPKGYIDARSETACDMQYVSQGDFGAMPLGDTKCLVQRAHLYNGNDLVWLSVDGSHSTDVSIAQVMSADEARQWCKEHQGYVAWAKPYIDGRLRRVVTSRRVNLKEALRGTGIKIIKPKRPRKDRANCVGCGRFLYEAAIYDNCPNCGADNRP